MDFYTIIDDIIDVDDTHIRVFVYVRNADTDAFEVQYNLGIDLDAIGVTNEMDYEFQLSKDIERRFQRLYNTLGRLPHGDELEQSINNMRYITIES